MVEGIRRYRMGDEVEAFRELLGRIGSHLLARQDKLLLEEVLNCVMREERKDFDLANGFYMRRLNIPGVRFGNTFSSSLLPER